MEVKDYIAQWEEAKEMTEGKTMDDIRNIFGNDITNDLRVGIEAGIDHDIIDTNYKDILVTFVEKDGKAIASTIGLRCTARKAFSSESLKSIPTKFFRCKYSLAYNLLIV